jgi:hypothetical protein
MSKEARSEVIIFRLRKSHFDSLVKEHRSIKLRNVNTENQFVRKLVIDFVSGRLVYTKPDDRTLTPDG